VGGTATYVSNLVQGQVGLGHSVLLATGFVPERESEDEVLGALPFKRINNMSREISILKDLKASGELKKLIHEFKPDLIHTHTFKAGLLVRTLRTSIPIIHTFHGHHLYDPEFGYLKRSLLNWIERRLAKKASALVTVGKKVGQELLAVGVGESSKYFSIPPGIRALVQVDGTVIRRKFSLSESDIVVVWLGRFTRVKRPDLVVEVGRALPGTIFLMAGDGELLESIKKEAPGNVRCLGIQNRDEMWGIADIALCTSDSEGMPLALIEAQMAGVPVVSTEVGSISEIVENGVTGELTSNTPSALSQAVELLASSSVKRREMSTAAKTRAKRLFSEEVMVSAHQNLYERVLREVKK